LQDMLHATVSRRVRRQRRIRRQLIEKRRRLQESDDSQKPVMEANACVTLNGEQYCKQGVSTPKEEQKKRRMQAVSEYYEERGIDHVSPAIHAGRGSKRAVKPKAKHFRMRKGHARKLRMMAKKNKRKMLAVSRR